MKSCKKIVTKFYYEFNVGVCGVEADMIPRDGKRDEIRKKASECRDWLTNVF